MRERNGTRRRFTLASAILMVLCLITGSILAEYLVNIAWADKNLINLDGSEAKSALLTVSSNISAGAARKLGFKTVSDDDAQVWSTDTKVDIFRVSYDESGQVTVKSETSDKVIAPGTENSYSFSLKNPRSKYVDYSMWVEAKVEPEDLDLPVNVRMSGREGAWLLGNDTEWKKPLDLNGVREDGRLGRGQTSSYTLTWQWPFEQGTDELDTLLGDRAVGEDLDLTIVIHTLATAYSSGSGSDDSDDNGGNGGGNSGTTGTKPGPGADETTAPTESTGTTETTAPNESTGTNETTAPGESTGTGETGGSGDNNGSSGESRPSDENGNSGRPNGGQNNNQNRYDDDSNGDNDGTNGVTGDKNNAGNTNGSGSDKNGINETKPGTDKPGETIGNENGKEAGTTDAESGRKIPWWLFLLLLPLLLILLWRRRIYVTGFVDSMSGDDVNWRKKSDRIRPDGRFVFESMPFGKHTFTVTAPDGTEKASINWRLKRDNDVTGVKIEKQDGEYTVLAGKHVRAIELYFDTEHSELKLKPSKWAAIDTDKNVYTPSGTIPPADDGTNVTPGGLEVDENKKIYFDKENLKG